MTPFDAFYDLSVLLHRLLQLMYGPSGIKNTTDASLLSLASELGAWRGALPSSLAWSGTQSSLAAGEIRPLVVVAHP